MICQARRPLFVVGWHQQDKSWLLSKVDQGLLMTPNLFVAQLAVATCLQALTFVAPWQAQPSALTL